MRVKEAFRRIVIAPVITGLIIGCLFLGATAPKSIEPSVRQLTPCQLFLLKSSECPEDTMGWIGSSEDSRVNR